MKETGLTGYQLTSSTHKHTHTKKKNKKRKKERKEERKGIDGGLNTLSCILERQNFVYFNDIRINTWHPCPNLCEK